MTRFLRSALAAILVLVALAYAAPTPAAAATWIQVWDRGDAVGTTCFPNGNTDRPTLNPVGTCGNWGNRISSMRIKMPSIECVRFWTGPNYTGSSVTWRGTTDYLWVLGYPWNNNIESIQYGFNSSSGCYGF